MIMNGNHSNKMFDHIESQILENLQFRDKLILRLPKVFSEDTY